MLIQSTNLNNVRLMDFYQVMYATTGFLRKEDLVALGINSVTDEFNLKFTAFDTALKQARKTGYTEAIITADDVRDNVTIGFTMVIDGYTRFPDTAIADAATARGAVAQALDMLASKRTVRLAKKHGNITL